MRFLLYILFALSSINSALAQEPQGWLIYFGTSQIGDSKFSIHHELQLRDHKIIGDHNQTLIRVGGQYQFRPYFQGTLGYGFIHTESEGLPNNPFTEHRIYQEGTFSHGLSLIKFRHRLRLEERFIEGKDFRGRFRYCLFADVPFTDKGLSKNGIYGAFYDELFLNISDDKSLDAFDRNRLYGGVGFKFTNNLGVQLGYMRQKVNNINSTNHVLLSLHHKMKW